MFAHVGRSIDRYYWLRMAMALAAVWTGGWLTALALLGTKLLELLVSLLLAFLLFLLPSQSVPDWLELEAEPVHMVSVELDEPVVFGDADPSWDDGQDWLPGADDLPPPPGTEVETASEIGPETALLAVLHGRGGGGSAEALVATNMTSSLQMQDTVLMKSRGSGRGGGGSASGLYAVRVKSGVVRNSTRRLPTEEATRGRPRRFVRNHGDATCTAVVWIGEDLELETHRWEDCPRQLRRKALRRLRSEQWTAFEAALGGFEVEVPFESPGLMLIGYGYGGLGISAALDTAD